MKSVPFSFSDSGFHRLSLRAASEDSSIGTNQYVVEGSDTITAVGVEVEEKPAAEQNLYSESYSSVVSDEEPATPNVQAQSFELFENIDLKVCLNSVSLPSSCYDHVIP